MGIAGIIGTLAGVLLGGCISLFASWQNFHRERLATQRIATMQIASQLRRWLVDTSRTFRDHPVLYQPDPDEDPGDPHGYHFPTPSDIRDFPFATTPDRIAELRSKDAERLFDLIEQRRSAERHAVLTAEVEDYESAAQEFEPLIAQLYLDCISLYSDLAKQVGWNPQTVGVDELNDMKQRASPKQPGSQSAAGFPDPMSDLAEGRTSAAAES